jgi:hypothetical protein
MQVEDGQDTSTSAFNAYLSGQGQPFISPKRISFSSQFQTEDILIPLVALRLPWMVFIQGRKLLLRNITNSQF